MRKSVLASIAALAQIGLLLSSGCSHHRAITGEPVLLNVHPLTGTLSDRDVVPQERDGTPFGTVPHEGEIITIAVNNVFIRHLEDLLTSHVLVYAEVYDDGSDDPSTAVSKVLFNQEDQPSGVSLGLADRILYGPTPYKGFPIRVKFYIVQLAKDQKATVSRALNAAGAIATTAQPQAAPAIGVVIQALQAINALTKDDFELRFDMTFYPVQPIGQYAIDPPTTEPVEDTQREGRSITAVTGLRTGTYAVIKRELADRFIFKSQQERNRVATLSFDWAQDGFTNRYQGTSSAGGGFLSHELLRYQGGYLKRVVYRLYNDPPATRPDNTPIPIPGAGVRMTSGPNAGVDFGLTPYQRMAFDDQTYVVFSVLNGLPKGLDEQTLRASSKRDAERITKLLDNPTQAPLNERIGDQIDNIAASVKTAIEQQLIAREAARKVGQDPSFRTATDYAAYWCNQIQPPGKGASDPKDETAERRNKIARNTAILPTLNDLVLNMPSLRPDDDTAMTRLSKLTKDAFEAATATPAASAEGGDAKPKVPDTFKGRFRLKADSLKALTAADAG